MGKIDEVLEQLKKMKPKALILFGSAARGEMKKDSDIDILMVKETKKSFHDRISDVHFRLETNIPTDVLVLTPQEAKKVGNKSEFFRQILNEGKLVYGKL